jgi:phenylalanyl-tRNA synthetase beta chain
MRVPLSWLRDYVDVDLTPEALAERLTLLGMEVKGIERWGAAWRSVVVGELLTVERHPRADRLSLTTVTIGSGEPLRIVCGATNIAPGQRVPVALPGAVLPGDRRIERTEKMGIASEGMLCSGDELQLTTDADGILILPAETPLGVDLSDLYGDVVLDVDVKPNRGDALSLIGLAREVAAATGATLRHPVVEIAEADPAVAERLRVVVEEQALCTRFVGRWVSGVTVGAAPDMVQMRLRAAGMRPVSNIVDATNYVMLEIGKPTHAFDAAAVHDATIVVRRARVGERLETLDHVERDLDPETLVIADPRGPLAIAGVMGGAASEVADATTEVVIESAIFDPVSIRRAAKRFALRSEASLRFEKGQDIPTARVGADRVAQLVAAWAGGVVLRGRLDTDPVEPERSRIAFRPARVGRLLGATLGADEQAALLARVGIATEPAAASALVPIAAGDDPLTVTVAGAEALVAVVPTWRRDIAIEADIAEEVARVRGYETVPARRPETQMPAFRPSPLVVRDAVRQALVGAGIVEVITHALVAPRSIELLPWPDDLEVPRGEMRSGGAVVTVRNPLAAQHSVLRQHLVPSLLDVLATNERHGRDRVALFEVGKGYARGEDGPREWWRVGFVLAGAAEPASWMRPERPYDLDDAKAIVELIAESLSLDAPAFAADRRGGAFHPGRAAVATARLGETGGPVAPGFDRHPGAVAIAGHVAELHPDVLAAWDLRATRVLAGELAIAGVGGGVPAAPMARPLSRVPAVERDLAVVVREEVEAGSVDAIARRAAGDLLRGLRLFDVYRGAPLAPDEKSLAIRLVLQSPDRTLTDDEIDAVTASVTGALTAELGARLRT